MAASLLTSLLQTVSLLNMGWSSSSYKTIRCKISFESCVGVLELVWSDVACNPAVHPVRFHGNSLQNLAKHLRIPDLLEIVFVSASFEK